MKFFKTVDEKFKEIGFKKVEWMIRKSETLVLA